MSSRARSDQDRGEGGFTVVELVVVMALLMVAIVALLSSMTSATETAQYASDRNESLDQLRRMADDFGKDVRQGIRATAISASALTIRTYVNGTEQSVTWRAVPGTDGERFERVSGSDVSTYVLSLTTPDIFSYFGAPSADQVSRVRISLATQPDPRHPPVGVATDVEMRNAP